MEQHPLRKMAAGRGEHFVVWVCARPKRREKTISKKPWSY